MINKKVTAIIKTCNRPACLKKLVESIRVFYKDLPLVIIDDGETPQSFITDKNIRYLKLDREVGLSEGRNIAVKLVETPYVLLLDDDFVFTKKTKIEKLLYIIETAPFSIVGGSVVDFSKRKRIFHGFFNITKDILEMNLTRSPKRIGEYKAYDFILNFFLAKKSVLIKYPWDSELFIREHEVFFWNLRETGVLITQIDSVEIDHYPVRDEAYLIKRFDRLPYYDSLACKKIGVRKIVVVGESTVKFFGFYNFLSNILIRLQRKLS